MRPLGARRMVVVLAVFGALALAAVVLCPLVGYARVDYAAALKDFVSGAKGPVSPDVDILFYQRLPRVILALLAGGALALAGTTFQALLRNPLATPYTLGVAGGSALGAAFAINLGLAGALTFGPVSGIEIWSLAGGFAFMGVVYLLARQKGRFSMMGLLLAGVTLGLLAASLILFIRYVSRPGELVAIDRWMMGSLDVHGFGGIGALMPFLLPGVVLLVGQAGRLNQVAFGEEMAAGRGVDVDALQKTCFFGASLVTASVVAVVGPIGFVGLIVPHALRKIIGPDHRLLMPASFLGGGAFLAVCDLVSRTIIAPTELPVGIITAILGGPFFLALLVKRK